MKNVSSNHIIETENLQLIACEASHFEAFLRDKKELEPILSVSVPDSWPVFPDSIPQGYNFFKANLDSVGWMTYLFIHAKDRMLIGEGGYKGKPDKGGMVEIGYAIVPEYRRRGLAYEAAKAFTTRAFSYPEVKFVQAHTLKDGTASMRVLEKLGMKLVGTAHDPDEGEVLQWTVERKVFFA